MKEVEITTEIIKLDSFLKWSGIVVNGSDAKIIISEGMVKVNGEVETRRGRKITKGDKIEIENECYIVV
ncbi:RNA-binding S4 domain-containing protein [Clostridium sp. MSJ-11]|uniref:RNA-binding S4 domain-containing protein n=1 Tax=Clostridium mobile TaxID=2841512 RepID=A0ABS6EME7_9CLOT|nr:RNA-binding S4 domain-containing protein [Clostridium mobile]MBU5486406.1 RNA-binding S4 domain-containing protein [Clostridium mobile]